MLHGLSESLNTYYWEKKQSNNKKVCIYECSLHKNKNVQVKRNKNKIFPSQKLSGLSLYNSYCTEESTTLWKIKIY